MCQRLKDNKVSFEILDIKPSIRFPKFYKYADIRDKNSIASALTGSVVINLAAVHRDDVLDRSEYYKTNVLGAQNIVEICTKKGVSKLIFTSSVAVYGHAPKAVDEYGIINPSTNMVKQNLKLKKFIDHGWKVIKVINLLL